MNIIRSVIVDPCSDSFWEDTSAITAIADVRPVLILTTPYSDDGREEIQLQKMLVASGLQPEQYNIVQIESTQKVAWHQLREKLNPKVVFLIGISPTQLGISAMFQLNIVNHFNSLLWLPTISLAGLEQNAELKKQLWVSGMKPLFVDKTYGDVLTN